MDVPVTKSEVHFYFDGKGDTCTAQPAKFEWKHIFRDAQAPETLKGLGLSSTAIAALTADETRPRCTIEGDGVLINLRGVNLNEGQDPEDMVSVRFYVDEKRVIGVWQRPLQAVNDLVGAIQRGVCPISPGDLIAKVALRLADRAEPIVADLNDRVDALEEKVLDEKPGLMRKDLADIRRMAILLRRYMFPQRDALTTLEIEDVDWLNQHDRNRIREAADRTTRLAEELEAIRDRATVVQEQIMDLRSEIMSRSMLMLAVVTAIFLPLGLIAGLFGMNVGGIPGTSDGNAFWIICGLLGILIVVQLWLFKWMRIF